MKKERMFWASILFLLVLLSAVVNMSLVYAQSPNWEYTPYNWKNSPNNFVNTVYDWNNNADNWKNSAYNWNSASGLYDAQGGTGRGNGDGDHGDASAPDEPGVAETHRDPQQIENRLHFHQPGARKGGSDVRESRNDPGWQGPEVLRQRASGHPAQGHPQGCRRQRDGEPCEGESGQKQGGAAFLGDRVRHHLQPRHQQRGQYFGHRHRKRGRGQEGRLAAIRGRIGGSRQ